MCGRAVPVGGPATWVLLFAVAVAVASCGGGDDAVSAPDWVQSVGPAVAAVEAELGGPQHYFEVTANPQVTNVFVAVDDATAAIPYAFVDGELLDPAPRLDGASGNTFTATAIGFDERRVLSGIEEELPEATIVALSVEGAPNGAARYIVTATSELGGVLDIEVGADGSILAVTPR